ncbi:MAG TPA: helix-turn-helix transcriptional regulator [Alphaproteobacteria bacterium]|nr:helix-turn-helix transcriptional regulator [Alphaproteobacteria bacterium]
MDRVQIIHTPQGEKMAVLPLDEYEQLRAKAGYEDFEEEEEEVNQATRHEIEETIRRIKSGEERTIPGEVAFAKLDGVHPVRAWRNYRKWTAEKLARKARIARVYLTQIENRKRKGTVAVYKALAKALGCSVEDLVG